MALTSPVNQTFWTDVAIGALSSDQLNPLLLSPAGGLALSTVQDFSNSTTGLGLKTSDMELAARSILSRRATSLTSTRLRTRFRALHQAIPREILIRYLLPIAHMAGASEVIVFPTW